MVLELCEAYRLRRFIWILSVWGWFPMVCYDVLWFCSVFLIVDYWPVFWGKWSVIGFLMVIDLLLVLSCCLLSTKNKSTQKCQKCCFSMSLAWVNLLKRFPEALEDHLFCLIWTEPSPSKTSRPSQAISTFCQALAHGCQTYIYLTRLCDLVPATRCPQFDVQACGYKDWWISFTNNPQLFCDWQLGMVYTVCFQVALGWSILLLT